jgi:hypothetical protein
MNKNDNLSGTTEQELNELIYQDIESAGKLTFQDIKDHISGPVVSVVLHVIALAFLSTIIVFHPPDEGKDIEVKEVQVEIKEIEKIPEPPEPEEVEVEQEIEIERPDVTTEDTQVEIEDVAVEAPAADVVMPNILSVKPSNSALVMPALFGGRTGNGRKSALKRYGGSGRTERAVLRGLRWLKDHQNSDGSWGDTRKNDFCAFTGFALLAFLAHGETPSSPEFGPTVLKAIKKLVEYAGSDANKLPGGYRHGIVMYALSEAYAVTQIPMIKDIVDKGITRIVKGMNAKGSFNYNYKNTPLPKTGQPRSDLSVAGWNYQALKAAFAAGSTAEGLEAAIDKAINTGLKKTHKVKSGGFSYTEKGGATGTMTSVGTLCLQLYGEGNSPEAKAGLQTLLTPKFFWISWKGNNGVIPQWSLYQWYYETQAMFQGFHGRGGGWKKWNRMFTKELLKRQKSDGRWLSPVYEFDKKALNHGEKSFVGLDQPVYATSLCCLMLEVYYRYLPTFKVSHHRTPKTARKDEEENPGLEIKWK